LRKAFRGKDYMMVHCIGGNQDKIHEMMVMEIFIYAGRLTVILCMWWK